MADDILSEAHQRVRKNCLDNYTKAHNCIFQLQHEIKENERLNTQETHNEILAETVSCVESMYTFLCHSRDGVIQEIEKAIKKHADLIGNLYAKEHVDDTSTIRDLRQRIINQNMRIDSHHRMLMELQAQLDKLSKTDGPPRTVDAHAHNLTDFTNATALQHTQSSTEYNV